MSLKPLISVIMPVFNQEKYVGQALESIVDQNYQNLEVLVVDDHSTDSSEQVIMSFQGKLNIKYIKLDKNRGVSYSRNQGISAAKGEIVAFLDSDDEWPAGKLKCQLEYLSKHPKNDVVMGVIRFITCEGIKPVNFYAENVTTNAKIYGRNKIKHVNLGSGIFRKEVFKKVGMFDELLRSAEDNDWFLRAREKKISIDSVDDVTLNYRRHRTNLSKTYEISREMFAVLRSSIVRRKKNNLPIFLGKMFQ